MEKMRENKSRFDIMRFLLAMCFVLGMNITNVGGQVLTLNELVRQVISNHPRSKQINLQAERASANLTKAKGSFDPVFDFNWNQKDYGGKNYYNLLDADVRIPTRFGLDFKTGYEVSRGLFLNPENNTPGGGLLFAGVSLPLGQGLFIDQRRANLRKAEIGKDMAGLDILLDQNELIYQSVIHYVEWQQAFEARRLMVLALDNIDQRYEAIRSQVLRGDRAGLDTVEIKIQKQLIQISLRQTEVELQNARIMLDTYFWNENVNSGIPGVAVPETMDNITLPSFISDESISVIGDHPLIRQYGLKGNQLGIEKRLLTDRLKPNLIFSYNPIFEPLATNPFSDFQWTNQKLGLSFYMPLLLRKERGDIRLVNASMMALEMEVKDKTSLLYGKYMAYLSELNALDEQVKLYDEAVLLYRQMFEAENRLFESGESSLFLVNTREQNLVQAQLKLVEYKAKRQKIYFSMIYTAGKLVEIFS
jgi:outer membrane protein TolC